MGITRDKYINLFEKYLRNEASSEDIDRLISVLKEDEAINEFFETELLSMSSDMPKEIQERLFADIIDKINIDRSRRRVNINYKPILKWVAVLVLPLLSALFVYVAMNRGNVIGDNQVTVSASNGEKAEVVLSDGSKVWINSGSQITYDNSYNKKQRKVVLDGEAFFEVAKNENCPFIVVANDLEVEAMGTAFNINAYSDDSHMSSVLLDGKIKVNVLDKNYILDANERVVLHKRANVVTRDTVNASDFTQWKNGRLYFRNNSFEEIANTLMRTFNVDIKFESEALRNIRFTGTLGNSSIRNALDILSLTSAMRYEMDGTTIALHLKSE